MKIKIFFRNGEFIEIECDDIIIKEDNNYIEFVKRMPKYNWTIAYFYKDAIAGLKKELF